MTQDDLAVRRRDAIWVVTLAIGIGAFYVATLRPDVGGTEDSPKFQFLGQVLGTAHSPGYPFYTVATYLFTRVPIGTLAYRVNLFSALAGVLSCLCIFWMARRLGVPRLLSATAALAAATSFPLWSNSIVAEVYTLAALMSALTVLWLMTWAQDGPRAWLYAACAVFAAGLGNHLTIVGLLPAALVYGVSQDRSVLKPGVIAIAAVIGTLGVAQYGFVVLRTMQRAPYLEARATTLPGVYDVITARDTAWARFNQTADAVVSTRVPLLLEGLRAHMGTVAVAFVLVAIVAAIRRKQADVLLITGSAVGTLAIVANLSGDIVGFITPVVVLLWPLAASGLHTAMRSLTGRETAVTAAGVIALALPVTTVARERAAIELIRQPGETPALRALYGRLPAGSALVAENYFIGRLVNYLHFSNEYDPDPNPQLLESNVDQIKAAVAEGRPVYALEGAMPWLASQGLAFAATGLSRQPFDQWLAQQPDGTLIVAAAAGRLLPLEWLPGERQSTRVRPLSFGAFTWTTGGATAQVEQSDTSVAIERTIGSDARAVVVTASDDGPRILWGDTVLAAIDRGLLVAAIAPSGQIAGNWAFAPAETIGAQRPPTALVYRGERPCAILRKGQPTDVSTVLADGGWLATFEGAGAGTIAIEGSDAAGWRHDRWTGRGAAAIDPRQSQLTFEVVPGARSVFGFSLARPAQTVTATLASASAMAARVCQVAIPDWPATGALDVSRAADAQFGEGWHSAERVGTQSFRWAARVSTLRWRLPEPSSLRLLLRLRAASPDGATVFATVHGSTVGTCALVGGEWTDCLLTLASTSTMSGVNELVLTSTTAAPGRAGDARDLALVMQSGRVRVGR